MTVRAEMEAYQGEILTLALRSDGLRRSGAYA